MSTDVRATFAAAAHCFADLVETVPATAWGDPGLGEWDLRSLVGHTSRSLSTLITYLRRPAAEVTVPTAADYYQWAVRQGGADPTAVTERGRAAGIAIGPEPAAAIMVLVDEALAALDTADGDPVIETIAGGMRLGDYVPTRTFELTVHTLDIAAALGRTVTLPAQALSDSVQLAAELAILQDAGPSLLLALTGRTRLPETFSVV